jgi:hypothetical protein
MSLYLDLVGEFGGCHDGHVFLELFQFFQASYFTGMMAVRDTKFLSTLAIDWEE